MRVINMVVMMVFLLVGCSSDFVTNESQLNDDEVEEIGRHEHSKKSLIQKLPSGVTSKDWNLILVNPQQALPVEFDVELITTDNEQQIDQRIDEAWQNWREAALQEGHHLFLASAFRSVSRQDENYKRTIQEYLAEGLSNAQAVEKAKEYLTEPGHSEHHTGLALDIVDEEWIVSGEGLEPEYAGEDSQKWLVSSMTDYGFILRYPEGKEEITGINYEPWHFRYVGVENATFIEANDLTLEEYIELLEEAGR